MSYFLETERLALREWAPGDLPLAQALWRDPEVMRHLGGPWSDDAILGRFHAEITSQAEQGVSYWPLFVAARETGHSKPGDRTALPDREFAGCAGLRRWPAEPGRWFELGVHLHRKFWTGGIAEEAARAVVRYAFTTLGADGLVARHGKLNRASAMQIHRLGFQRVEDTFWAVTGQFHPTYRMEAGSESARRSCI